MARNFYTPITLLNISRFLNFFTFKITRQFVVTLSLNIPPNLKCVATLHGKISVSLKQQLKKGDICNNTFYKN